MPEQDRHLNKKTQAFMSQLHDLLDLRERPISSFFIESLQNKYNVYGDEADQIIKEMGWRKSEKNAADVFEKIPSTESDKPIRYQPPQRIIVTTNIPKVDRYRRLTNSDGQLIDSEDH